MSKTQAQHQRDQHRKQQERIATQRSRADKAEARVVKLEAAIRTAFDELDMRHIEKNDEDTAHELRKLKWALESKGVGA